jgi:hypothetical protein
LTEQASTSELISSALAAHPAVQSVTVEPVGHLRVVARSLSREWTLRVILDPALGLPTVHVLDEGVIGTLAHVNYNGQVCFTDNEGLSVDVTRPAAVVTQALTDALAELDRNLARHAAGDDRALLDEFEGYWYSMPGARAVDVHLALDDAPREIAAFTTAQRECVAFTERHQLKHATYAGLQRLGSLPQHRALYVPLSRAVQPLRRGETLSAERVRHWIEASASATTRARLETLLKSWPKRSAEAFLLLSQPRSDGSVAAFAVQWTGKPARHPLLDRAARRQVRPLVVRRHAAQYLRARGGSAEPLALRHVAVVGCGAVGSRIAEHLALAGVGALSLIDPKRFQPDNLYRHVLGGSACDVPKVLALQRHLEQRLPSIGVRALEADLLSWAGPASVAELDGLVIAIGQPHIERQFLQRAWSWTDFRAPIITTWLEPLGLGGHAQRTVCGTPGCLECLYTGADGRSLLTPRIAFAEPDQALSRNMTGCAGSFTPYSALDATQTALIATRLLTDALTGEASPSYTSWRGGDQQFSRAGFRTTPWYQSFDELQLKAAQAEYRRVPCPVCGGAR